VTLPEAHRLAGAAMREIAGVSIPVRFTDPAEEFEAGRKLVAIADRSHQARLEVTGGDRVSYLGRITSGPLKDLAPRGGARTAVVERTGKIVDVVTVHAFPEHLLLIGSAAHRPALVEWLGRFIFRDDVQIHDRTIETGAAQLLGPRAAEVAAALIGPAAASLPIHGWAAIPERPGAVLIRSAPIGAEAFLLVGAAGEMGALWDDVLDRGRAQGLAPIGEEAFQVLRILGGVSEGGAEIDARANPLELGLEDAVDLRKGCFTGQEALAKMVTYEAVKRRLIGLDLGGPTMPAPDAAVHAGDESVGRVTSAAAIPGASRGVALAVVRREHAKPGTRLRCAADGGRVEATVVPLPFPSEW